VVQPSEEARMSGAEMMLKILPLTALILIVLGGIYSGSVTASEAGAAGAMVAFLIGLLKRQLGWQEIKEVLVETGHITASILFLITAATMYSRMLGIAGLPSLFSAWLAETGFDVVALMTVYVVLLVFLGTIIDTSSIILICAPLFMTAIEDMGLSLVWFGIVTVVGAEIGLLTPPFGLSCFVIKTAIDRPDISLSDVFIGAAPFALVMLAVLIAIVTFPALSIGILG
jgi:tripartite ATP-independent transporter DctM subunit